MSSLFLKYRTSYPENAAFFIFHRLIKRTQENDFSLHSLTYCNSTRSYISSGIDGKTEPNLPSKVSSTVCYVLMGPICKPMAQNVLIVESWH